jgi:hypothetical protein
MLTRKLLVVTANDRDQGPSDLVSLLGRFEKQTTHLGLTGDLSNLTKRMLSHEPGVVLNLNQRLKKGRNELMHGNVLRMMESEGHLLVLLVDLLVLHAMKEELEAPRADA